MLVVVSSCALCMSYTPRPGFSLQQCPGRDGERGVRVEDRRQGERGVRVADRGGAGRSRPSEYAAKEKHVRAPLHAGHTKTNQQNTYVLRETLIDVAPRSRLSR